MPGDGPSLFEAGNRHDAAVSGRGMSDLYAKVAAPCGVQRQLFTQPACKSAPARAGDLALKRGVEVADEGCRQHLEQFMDGASAGHANRRSGPARFLAKRVCWVGWAMLPLALCGCETVALTALGVGASAGVNHTANGVSTRTFTATAAQVRSASLAALNRMGISVTSIDNRDGIEVIRARSAERQIEVELETMNKSTTQMRASAKHNFFVYDAATGREIVEQTERAMTSAPERRAKTSAAASPQQWVRASTAGRAVD